MAEQTFTCRDVEQHLAPFVDGAEAPDTSRAIEAHLKRCPPCAERAAQERAGRSLLADCRDTLRARAPDSLRAKCACHALPRASSQAPASSGKPASWKLGTGNWLLPLAASVLLAVAVVFALGLNDRVQALAAGLALDHLKCFKVGDSVHPLDAAVVERNWQRERGWPLQIAHADDSRQLELVAVRRCLSTSGMTAHLMYRWHGQPLSVFVLPRAVPDAGTLDTMGHETAIWTAGGRTYAVMAEGHPAGFDHIVSYVREHTR